MDVFKCLRQSTGSKEHKELHTSPGPVPTVELPVGGSGDVALTSPLVPVTVIDDVDIVSDEGEGEEDGEAAVSLVEVAVGVVCWVLDADVDPDAESSGRGN